MFNQMEGQDFDSKRSVLSDTIKELVRTNEYVSEIETNGPGLLFYKERGKRKSMPLPLKTEEEYAEAVDGLIEDAGFIKSKYLVEGRYALPGDKFGRLHIAMPPATPNPLITLAIKTTTLNDLTSIQSAGSFNTEISLFFRAAVASKLTIVLSGGTGAGKALHKDTKIPTPEGFKTVGELNVGDTIFDENGDKTKIEKKYSPNDPDSYEITFKSGQKVKTSAGHLWNVINLNKKEAETTISTDDMFNEGVEDESGKLNFAINYLSKEVGYEEKDLKIDPYTLGVWLNNDKFNHESIGGEELKHYDLLNDERIPDEYKTSSIKQRISLLMGLIDKDVVNEEVSQFKSDVENVVKDVREVIMSLGWNALPISTVTETNFNEKGNLETKESYTFLFTKKEQGLTNRHYITDIRKIDDNPEDYFCFQVDSPSHLFLCTEEFIPTHNTTLLEALTNEIPIEERVGVCEDTPELELQSPNTPYLNSTVRVPGMAAEDVADLSWVVQQINRMRVDRVIIGETRGKEFFDFVVAANSGKPGSLTTIHANNGPAAMKKMATFMYMAVDMSPRIINEMISEAVDIVIQMGHNEKTGAHKILSVHEVTDAISTGDSPTIALNPLFLYDHESDTWTRKYATDNLKSKLTKAGYDPNSYTLSQKEEEFDAAGGGLPSYFNKRE